MNRNERQKIIIINVNRLDLDSLSGASIPERCKTFKINANKQKISTFETNVKFPRLNPSLFCREEAFKGI